MHDNGHERDDAHHEHRHNEGLIWTVYISILDIIITVHVVEHVLDVTCGLLEVEQRYNN